MFYLYQSDRLEALAEMCAHIHQALPLDVVLAQEEVVVQSQGIQVPAILKLPKKILLKMRTLV